MKTVEQRFHAKVAPANAAGCQLWTAGTRRGYGQFGDGARMVNAHRFAWELASGPIPDGMCVCHKCDVRACCNPAHLFLGTNADNMADMVAKGRGRPPDNRGTKHGRAKLTEAQAVEAFHADGKLRAIGARLGVSPMTVCNIKCRKSWTHATANLTTTKESRE